MAISKSINQQKFAILLFLWSRIDYVHCREEGYIGLYIPDNQEISRSPRDFQIYPSSRQWANLIHRGLTHMTLLSFFVKKKKKRKSESLCQSKISLQGVLFHNESLSRNLTWPAWTCHLSPVGFEQKVKIQCK